MIDPFDPAGRVGLAQFLNEFFNGVDCPQGQEKIGFFLVAYRFDESLDFKFTSNLTADEVRALLTALPPSPTAIVSSTEGS